MPRTAVAVLLVVLTACAQPVAVPDGAFDEDLGVPPVVTEDEPAPAAEPQASSPQASVGATTSPSPSPASPEDGEDRSSPVAPTTDPAPSEPAPAGTVDPAAPVVLLAVADAAGDHGPQGPDWTDLRSVELVELGNDLRVTLRFGGPLPSAPAAGEVPLLGVDVGDDGHQLFVEGGGESWGAYLDTPDGFVPYPGTFELAGSAMILQVPFSALGSPTRAPVRVFVEWSRDSGLVGVLNPTSEDRLDGEPHRFDRAP